MDESRPAAAYRLTKRHTPLPRSRSVVIVVTKIVEIDRPKSLILDHVELLVAVLRGHPPLAGAMALPIGTRRNCSLRPAEPEQSPIVAAPAARLPPKRRAEPRR